MLGEAGVLRAGVGWDGHRVLPMLETQKLSLAAAATAATPASAATLAAAWSACPVFLAAAARATQAGAAFAAGTWTLWWRW